MKKLKPQSLPNFKSLEEAFREVENYKLYNIVKHEIDGNTVNFLDDKNKFVGCMPLEDFKNISKNWK